MYDTCFVHVPYTFVYSVTPLPPCLLHLTQKWRLCLHQCDDAVGEFVLDAAARAAEPRGDPALLDAVNAALDDVDVEVALARAARERALVKRHAVG